MNIIGLAGPNAVGKTTALTRWCHRFPTLRAALADNEREATGPEIDAVLANRPNAKGWKGDIETKKRMVQRCRDRNQITVIDSARTTALEHLGGTDRIILVTCTGELLGKNLESRCLKSGKPFRRDYWNFDKLHYEAQVRYGNFAKRSPAPVKLFTIRNYDDWTDIDEYFADLFRHMSKALS